MSNSELPAETTNFSPEQIYKQVQKIFADPGFVASDILKRFLTFIVEQTLAGYPILLKEYTIGMNVLNKSKEFNPKEDGIVRIHAGRLRRALNHYYNGIGVNDLIYISVPKGSYVPTFSDNTYRIKQEDEAKIEKAISRSHVTSIAVTPFIHQRNPISNSFTDGLCIQLSNALMNFPGFAVVAYQIMHHLFKKFEDIKEIASIVGAEYILTGNMQSIKERVRINIQMIEINTTSQVWSKIYERRFTKSDIFEL